MSTWAPCETCLHANLDDAPIVGYAFCTLAGGPFHGRILPIEEGCTRHVMACEDCHEAEAVNSGDRERCDNCAEAVWDAKQRPEA